MWEREENKDGKEVESVTATPLPPYNPPQTPSHNPLSTPPPIKFVCATVVSVHIIGRSIPVPLI
jgi:hypothetical protein